MIDIKICQQARLTRDPRFDGKFFIGVKTTGIFCRTVCPAKLPMEKNVQYFETTTAALQAGFRPCLRCRPDSLPHSHEWNSKDYFLNKILRLLESGELEDKKLYELCQELNITPRYLHKIFVAKFGIPPKKYEIFHKCFLAKQLIQETALPIGEIAYACGFSSISLFNNTFKQHIKMTPTALRHSKKKRSNNEINLSIHYQAPYDWDSFLHFQSQRLVSGLESIDNGCYHRNVVYKGVKGRFSVKQNLDEHCFNVAITLDDLKVLQPVLANIRRLLDIDTNLDKIESIFREKLPTLSLHSGLRIPGIWDIFEAGIRAICGQQISIAAATTIVTQIVHLAGTQSATGEYYFPTPKQLADFDFSQLRTTHRRKETLMLFAQYCHRSEDYLNPDNWLPLKGIGAWTINYAKLRGLGDPDIWMLSDLGIKNALTAHGSTIDADACKPWRSYLGLQLWSNLNV